MSKNPQPNKGGWEGIDLTPTLSLLRRGGFKPHPSPPLQWEGTYFMAK